MMHGHEKSDFAIVAVKPTNKAEHSATEQSAAEPTAAEPVEPRAETKRNAGQQSTCGTQGQVSVSQALERIRRVAKERKKEKFTSLLHHISIDLLDEAFFELKEEAAPGVDGLTWTEYEQNLDRNLEDLHARVHRGAYRALPSRRVYIPKPDGRQRPLAVAALEDKIVQRATVAVLNAIYEEDFLGFSYGFRPGRGAHDAMDALVVAIEHRKVNRLLAISMLLRCCAACPPSGSPRRATAHRSVRFVSIRVSAFCPPYGSARAEHALVAGSMIRTSPPCGRRTPPRSLPAPGIPFRAAAPTRETPPGRTSPSIAGLRSAYRAARSCVRARALRPVRTCSAGRGLRPTWELHIRG